MTEKEYRELDRDSYSTLKVFADDRMKYYRKFIKRDLVDKEDSDSIIFGSLVDCLQFRPYEFDNRFALAGVNPPTGQMGEFVKMLYKITLENTAPDGSVQRDFKAMMLDAYDRVKYDKDGTVVAFKQKNATVEAIIEKFLGSDAEIYYKQKRDSYGKYVIEQSDLSTAENIVNTLKTCTYTWQIMKMETNSRFEVHTQFPILFEIHGLEMKSLLDKLVIDHIGKQIYIYDLKTNWDNENEFINSYLRFRYYIQAWVYYYGVIRWILETPHLSDYQVNFPSFVVAESNNYKLPLIYTMSWENIRNAGNGFVVNGKEYKGVPRLIQELQWHKENDIWNTSYDAFHASGVFDIPVFEEPKTKSDEQECSNEHNEENDL